MDIVPIARTKLSTSQQHCKHRIYPVGNRGEGDKKGEKATVKVTVKKSVEGTQEDLIELFHRFVKKFKMPHFDIKQQYAFCRELKNNMSGEETLIQVDFSEYYSCKYSSQVRQSTWGFTSTGHPSY